MNRFFSPKPKPESKPTLKPVFDFPELSTKAPTVNATSTENKMNYKNKLEIEQKRKVVNTGHISIFYDTHTRKVCIENKEIPTLLPPPRQIPISFQKLVTRWEKWYDDYIELYGEDIYSSVHLYPYPFYNYNYFNELDEIFYKELEELENLEENEYDDYQD